MNDMLAKKLDKHPDNTGVDFDVIIVGRVSLACISFTVYAIWVCECEASRQGPGLGERGTGTAIPVHASTLNRISISTGFPKKFWTNGIGVNASPRSQRPSAI